jgi:ubiquitin-like protein 4
MRSGDTVTISNITLNSTVHDLKSQYAEKSGQPLDKIKLLLNKKPAADLKTLKEMGVEGDVELSVMVMGGASAATTPAVEKMEPVMPAGDKMDIDSQAPAPESEKATAEAVNEKAAVESVEAILKTEEFWTDLKGFLAQRLRDQGEGEKLAKVFRDAYSRR